MSYVQIQTTHDDREALGRLVSELVEEHLIACGKVLGPIWSQYRWDEKLQSAEEWIALLNTPAALVDQAVAAIRSKHSYEVPEILVFDVQKGLPSYLKWMDESTKSIA